jgi:hypothetical protein
MKLFIYNFLQVPATSFFLGPNIHLSTLFSNNLNLCFSFRSKYTSVDKLWEPCNSLCQKFSYIHCFYTSSKLLTL